MKQGFPDLKKTECSSMPLRFFLFLLLTVFSASGVAGQKQPGRITVHLRNVYSSKVTLLTLSGNRTFQPYKHAEAVSNGDTSTFRVSKELLPGEFVLRFDYREKESSNPYPSEKYFFMNDQDLDLWVNPVYCNNPDSTRFQEGEKENHAFMAFSKENSKHREQLGLLQNFLMNYDDTGSKFYKAGIKEYEGRRKSYNKWLNDRTLEDSQLFVSSLYCFQKIPKASWKGTEAERINDLITHYFDEMDFTSPLILRTAQMNRWMDDYVNLYGQLSATVALRDSLLTLAGKTAIGKARKGDPLVYGWMVDYFFRGYEANGIPSGTKMLEPYLDDPGCMTSKRQEIERRLKGIKTLVAGSKAPEISMNDINGELVDLYNISTSCEYVLVLFWSAGCSHCLETIAGLYPWQQQPGIKSKVMVLAISLDETEPEIRAWHKKTMELPGWKHLRASEGIRSKVASDYFVLASPVMVLLEAGTKEIVSSPNTLDELTAAIK
jgi:hypothetical protein